MRFQTMKETQAVLWLLVQSPNSLPLRSHHLPFPTTLCEFHVLLSKSSHNIKFQNSTTPKWPVQDIQKMEKSLVCLTYNQDRGVSENKSGPIVKQPNVRETQRSISWQFIESQS
jgi:hypothetical protein